MDGIPRQETPSRLKNLMWRLQRMKRPDQGQAYRPVRGGGVMNRGRMY